LIRNNCESCARWCKTGEFTSAQVGTAAAAAGALAGTTAVTAAAVGIVSANGAVVGTSAAGLMSGLRTLGRSLVEAQRLASRCSLRHPPRSLLPATHYAFRDDARMPAPLRLAKRGARNAGTLGAVVGTVGTIGAISAAGVPGLSAIGITSGLAALGGTMLGGIVICLALPAAIATLFACTSLSSSGRSGTPAKTGFRQQPYNW